MNPATKDEETLPLGRAMAFVAATLGALATLVPWALHASGLAGARVHSDLWISLAFFGVLLVVLARGRAPRIAIGVVGLLTLAVAGSNLPRVWQAATASGGNAVDELLRGESRGYLACYVVVALAALGLTVLGFKRRA